LTVVVAELHDGATFAEALAKTGRWVPEFDQALLEAGEKSGRIDACLKLLATYYGERARLARTVLNELAYPLFVLHAALFIMGFPNFFLTGNWQLYLLNTFGILVPMYVAVFVVIYLMQGSRRRGIRIALEKIIGFIPFVGEARRHLALARLAIALESLLNAGVNVIDSWELAARASGSPALDGEVSTWREQIEAGVQPSELLRHNSRFPVVFANLYATGEISGRLDDHLGRIHTFYHESGARILQQIATWSPKLMYFLLCLYLAYQIITFYTGYFQRAAGGE
jgi:type II secretory pathway component PulF